MIIKVETRELLEERDRVHEEYSALMDKIEWLIDGLGGYKPKSEDFHRILSDNPEEHVQIRALWAEERDLQEKSEQLMKKIRRAALCGDGLAIDFLPCKCNNPDCDCEEVIQEMIETRGSGRGKGKCSARNV